MKKFIITLALFFIVVPVQAVDFHSNKGAVKKVINSQIKYANRGDFDKFIATYDKDYINSDGFNLEVYSDLVKGIWESYDNIKYNVKIKKISIDDDKATVEVVEYANADLILSKKYTGELNSESNNIYYLKKINGKWKVVSDSVLSEKTTMLYGDVKNLDIKLNVPAEIQENTEYTASLEFDVPQNTLAIASISSDIVEYPQKPAKEVFRAMPEDNILERLFTSNGDNANEYIIASIGLTKTDVCDLSIKMSLTGFGYVIKRVNVIHPNKKESTNE